MEEKERFALIGERHVRQQEQQALQSQVREQVKLLLNLYNNLNNATAGSTLRQDWLEPEIERLRRIHALREQMRTLELRVKEITRLIG